MRYWALASLAVFTALPATAAGVPRQSVVSRMTTEEPGASTGSYMQMRFVNPADPQGKPYAVDTAVIQMAEGARIDNDALPQCNVPDAELIARGEDACPPGSKVQTGTVEFDTGSPFLFPRVLHVRSVTFNTEDGMVSVGQSDEFPVRAVGHTRVDGRTVTVDYPDFPGGPPDSYAAMRDMVTSGPAMSGAESRPFMTTPPSCPPSGRWVTNFTFIYHDGVRETAAAESPCRPGPGAGRAGTEAQCAGSAEARRSGPNIIGSHIRVVRVGCRRAKRLLRRYFRKVLRTAQTPAGCAQRRTSVGCQVYGWRCTVRGRDAGRRLAGRCASRSARGTRVIRFDERDVGAG